MGLFDFFRNRRERESASSFHAESIQAAVAQANQASPDAIPGEVHHAFTTPWEGQAMALPAGFDYGKAMKLQAAVLEIFKQHGINPMRPDPSKFMDPDLQRDLQNAVAQSGLGFGAGGPTAQ